MLKDIVEALKVMGLEIPMWIGLLMLITALVSGIYYFLKKVYIPWIEKMIKRYNDIKSISTIKENAEKCDELLIKEIKSISENMATLTAGLEEVKKEVHTNKESQGLQCEALKMILAGELDRKYRRFIELGYVPDMEFNEYVRSYESYAALGGNGTGKEKYDYIMKHLERKTG